MKPVRFMIVRYSHRNPVKSLDALLGEKTNQGFF